MIMYRNMSTCQQAKCQLPRSGPNAGSATGTGAKRQEDSGHQACSLATTNQYPETK